MSATKPWVSTAFWAHYLAELNAEVRRDGLDDLLLSTEFVILGQSVFAENLAPCDTADVWSGLLTAG
jgi:hypothetical protein